MRKSIRNNKTISRKIKSFSVFTYSSLNKKTNYCHWSEGLTMIIEKDGVTIKLDSDDIQKIVKSLPRTMGGKY